MLHVIPHSLLTHVTRLTDWPFTFTRRRTKQDREQNKTGEQNKAENKTRQRTNIAIHSFVFTGQLAILAVRSFACTK